MTLFKPMLAASETPDLNSIVYPCLASPKLDGIRCVMIDGVPLSRSLKLIPNKHVRETMSRLPIESLDGELMVDGDFNSVQSAIMQQSGKPNFYFNVFDHVSLAMGFYERHKHAANVVKLVNSPILRMVPHVIMNDAKALREYWDTCIEQGYEGAMVRSITGPYKFGRSTLKQGYLIKLKKWHDADGVIRQIKEGQTNLNEAFIGELGQTKRSSDSANKEPNGLMGSMEVWCDELNTTVEVGTGFDQQQRMLIFRNKDKYIGKKITFKYQELTKYGHPRFPVFKGFRRD
jgi:DNA ligase-1